MRISANPSPDQKLFVIFFSLATGMKKEENARTWLLLSSVRRIHGQDNNILRLENIYLIFSARISRRLWKFLSLSKRQFDTGVLLCHPKQRL
jgi:hypothetical protein